MGQLTTYKQGLYNRINLPVAHRIGISTGFDKLDKVMRGFHGGKLYTIGARPGDGKTSFCTTLAANLAELREAPVLMFSTELDEWEVLDQMVESAAGGTAIFPDERTPLRHEIERLRDAASMIEKAMALNLVKIVCNRKFTTTEIGVQAAEFFDGVHRGVDGLIIIDQASRVARDDAQGRRSYAIATENMLNDLEALTAVLNLPVLLMSQANRDADKMKHPTMANLKHSGAFEEFSHFVAMLEKQELNEATFWVEKNRHGRTGPLKAKFYGESHSWDIL